MAKHPKGILGVRKNPKKQILFSFHARDGEEWPSDSDDSDYTPPSDIEEPSTSSSGKRKENGDRSRTKDTKRQKVGGTINENSNARVAKFDGYKGDPVHLPPEIWQKIFHYVVMEQGAVPFLIRASKVCQLFQAVTCDLDLWQKVDLSYGWVKFTDRRFLWLCANRLAECRSLNLSGCKIVSRMAVNQAIAEHCGQLRRLNLARCQKLSSDAVKVIVNGCKHLEDIDLTATSADVVSSQTLLYIIDRCRGNLRRLVVAENALRVFSTAFNALMEKCPNLEHLDISNAKFFHMTIDVERFQRACPGLHALGLANTPFRASPTTQAVRDESVGFPELRELSLAVTMPDMSSAVTHEVILRLLKTSEKLRLLDLRGIRNDTAISCLTDIPATHLEQLYLSRSSVTTYRDLGTCLNRWRDSLTELDLSWNNFREGILESALVTLCQQPPPAKLHDINLAGTPVNMAHVKKLVDSLPELRFLDLTSCREVSRGYKREYRTKIDIKKLKTSLHKAD